MNVTAEFRVGVIVVIEIPGGGIAARPLTVGRNLASARGIDGIDLQQEITAAVDIEVDRLQPVTKGQLQHKVRHHNVGATIAAVLTTGIDGEFRGVKVKTEFTGHLAPFVITPEPEITAINHGTAGVQVQVGRAVIANGNVHRSEEHTSELQSRPHLVC